MFIKKSRITHIELTSTIITCLYFYMNLSVYKFKYIKKFEIVNLY